MVPNFEIISWTSFTYKQWALKTTHLRFKFLLNRNLKNKSNYLTLFKMKF